MLVGFVAIWIFVYMCVKYSLCLIVDNINNFTNFTDSLMYNIRSDLFMKLDIIFYAKYLLVPELAVDNFKGNKSCIVCLIVSQYT